MTVNINRTCITGNLTRDPALTENGNGIAICDMRIAVNGRRKDGDEWVDKPGYFDVVVFGSQAKNCAQYLAKGRPIAVDGRLDWSEWQDKEGNKRQSVRIIGEQIQFLSSAGAQSSTEEEQAPEDIPF